MGFPNIFSIFGFRNQSQASNSSLPSYSPIHQNLVKTSENSTTSDGFPKSLVNYFRRFISSKKIDGGSRTDAEEKVYSWLYALAQSDKDLVYEYVRSTERDITVKNDGLFVSRRLGLNVATAS